MYKKYQPDEKTLDQIAKNFMYHPPVSDQNGRYESIRNKAKELAYHLAENVPASRELSLALTKLEECVMHANSGIARNE